MNLNPSQSSALKAIVDAVVETVKAAGTMGAPGGHLYAALMAHGCTLNQFQSLMGALVRMGMLKQKGDLYFA